MHSGASPAQQIKIHENGARHKMMMEQFHREQRRKKAEEEAQQAALQVGVGFLRFALCFSSVLYNGTLSPGAFRFCLLFVLFACLSLSSPASLPSFYFSAS